MENLIQEVIARFVEESPANRFKDNSGPYFSEPLVGYASMDDPLFIDYKKIIGDFHLTPRELLAANGGPTVNGTVICWILPVAEHIRISNRSQQKYPSREWAHMRSYGEMMNVMLRRHLVEWLIERGHRAVAPQLAEQWKELPETPVGRASTWSDRHAAYAAGLGTFSLNDGLITPKGIAHRIGSVVTDLVLKPTPRTYPDHRYNCLHYREAKCGACIGRCPVGAISHKGHNKDICKDYVYVTLPEAVSESYGAPQTGCGLCQTKVPCESAIP